MKTVGREGLPDLPPIRRSRKHLLPLDNRKRYVYTVTVALLRYDISRKERYWMKKRIAISLTPEIVDFLEGHSEKMGLRKSDIIAIALTEYKRKVKKQ